MTDTFWIAATVFILFALLFVLYPVFFRRSQARVEADIRNQNLIAYRTRQQELDDEYEAGVLDEKSYQQLKEELAGSMLDDVPENEVPGKRVPGRKSAMAVVLIALVFLPVGTYFGYQEWGAMDELEQFRAMQEMESSGGNQSARMAELADQLRERLRANPDNADGWAMLGQTYMRLQRYEEAAEAYRELARVTEESDGASASALGLAAQARFFASNGRITGEVEELVEAALALNEDEVNALGLLGISAFGEENYERAIEYWERIIAVAPDHPQAESIQEGIKEAYRRLGQTPPSGQASAEQPEPVASAGVSLRISLPEDVQQQVDSDTTLFVFARPLSARGGAPVAVARMTAGDLPTTIHLDDNYAMSANSAISAQEEVLVVARLTTSGSVNPQPGDWQGQVEAKVVEPEQGEPVNLVIDQQLTN
ncbi:cytochrome c-type biogenesis protein CcmH [Marinobacter persicus]|uniref:Cytochrome c-type biogenesis protein CcmH n=1 Tax=Marinobacter persicus TaxID=930118 RepID=A0A1I3S7A3_9GAMM|nr:c-type cytochrome biogenesis protein CcmI [Marinobacter persicus]GHD44967.1 cytochrome c-type biogenesis protein CycH [Marinobacter persicus]SFJ53406.1 cytochrome c-type biogenesis protein CcmH [Marinobacter persicus]